MRRSIYIVFALSVFLSRAQSVDIYCGDPPDIPSASLKDVQKKYPVGSSVSYDCPFGYATRGRSRVLKCRESDTENKAEWSQPEFSCTPQSCGDPGYINNGRRIGSLFTFPNSVKYECNMGYKLVGLSTRFCQTNGLWSGRLPACEEVTCKPPNHPENGHVSYSALEYESELKYKCDKGYHLSIDDETVFCTAEGTWSSTEVKCIETTCDVPSKPEQGSVLLSDSENHPREGSIAIFSCDGNRIPDGPTTSKCLESGEWTFPPPKCLDPCSIPYVTNGQIGRYVREGYRRQRTFKQVSVGYKIKDDEELYLHCVKGYEVPGSGKAEEMISCSRGKWSQEPLCEPASCRSQPPSVENAIAVALNPEHGGRVLYLCDEDFKKISNGTVFCDFGDWKGIDPVCKSTRCSVEDFPFPGVVKDKKFHRDGEVWKLECDSRYQLVNKTHPQLLCNEGTWRGTLPPCVAASCKKPPPEIKFGRPEVSSTYHTSFVEYICEEPYVPFGNSRVQCLFGEWEGQPPTCEDSRCYLKDLQVASHVDVSLTPSVWPSGYDLDVVCKEGYSPISFRPLCTNGVWTRNSISPCKEDDCVVPVVHNGDIKTETMGDYYWNWKSFRYDRQVQHIRIPAGTILPFASSVHIFCDRGFSFQGTSLARSGITCFKGKWRPDPVCLRVGERYIPPTAATKKPYSVTQLITKRSTILVTMTPAAHPPTTSTATAIKELPSEDGLEFFSPATEETAELETENPVEECHCEYPINDENLVAHAEGKRLQFLDTVRNGSEVVFRCEHVGFHKLNGKQEIKCEDCQKWHSSEFPTCTEPERGSAVILYGNTLIISVEGNLEARKGHSVTLMCVAMESNMYPHWVMPAESGVTIMPERRERDSYGDILYLSHLTIENVDLENEGLYGCAVGNNSMNFVNLVVIDPDLRCPEFPEDDGIRVTYDNERYVRSGAFFSCAKNNQKLSGKDTLTCLKNGIWSDNFPQCIDRKCGELKGHDFLSIYYTNDRKIGSKATFHCFAPAKRIGASFADCLESGAWSNPTPRCRTSPCPLDDLFSVVPQNIIPVVENSNKTVPFNVTVKLMCTEDRILVGNPVAKCGLKGEWEFEGVQCISGCPSPTKPPESNLIIKPQKDIYRLGEMVSFSCPPGMVLNTESQLIMCLKYGWSETILPQCE